jgi:O-antigen/teichoic acid export membrane protein
MISVIELLRTVYERLTAGGSTEEQAIQSGIWVAGINVGDRVLQLLKVIILARLLSPAAFGLLGIALLAIAALRQFSKLGFDEALIHHENEDVNAYLNTAWVMKIARGALIAAIAFFAAPYLAVFFGEPQAEPLIRVISISPLILGLQNPAVVYFQKDLNFHREFIYQIGGRLVDLVTAVVFALIFGSVWALAAGIVAMNFVKFALSYGIHNFRPKFRFNLVYGREMFGFGKWMFASAVLLFMYRQGDDAFVGWFFAATSLGFYQMAYRFSNAPATEVTNVISRVAFPAFSKVQNDVDRLREGYFRVVQLSSTIAFPMAAGIVAVAPQFVRSVLGNQWEPMIPLIQVLAIAGGLRAFAANAGAVFKAVGRPDYDVKLQAFKTVTIALTIFPAAKYFGVEGVALVILGSAIIMQPLLVSVLLPLIDGTVKELIDYVIYPLISSIVMLLIVVGVDRYIFSQSGIVYLLMLIVIGVVSYIPLMLLAERYTECEFLNLYTTVRRAI